MTLKGKWIDHAKKGGPIAKGLKTPIRVMNLMEIRVKF